MSVCLTQFSLVVPPCALLLHILSLRSFVIAEVMLEELYRSRDRLERDSEEKGSALRRTLTARNEQQAATERGLYVDTNEAPPEPLYTHGAEGGANQQNNPTRISRSSQPL